MLAVVSALAGGRGAGAAFERAVNRVCCDLLSEEDAAATARALVRGVAALLAAESVEAVVLAEDGTPLAAAGSRPERSPVLPVAEARRHRRAWRDDQGDTVLPLWSADRLVGVLRLSGARTRRGAALAGVQRSLAAAVSRNLKMYALQERFSLHRRLVDMAQEGIWLAGPDDRTAFVNARMAQMLGYRPEEMLGRPVYDFMPADQRPTAQDHLDCERLGEVRKSDFRLLRRDGSELWAIVSAGPVKADDGHYLGGLALVTDIGERKRMEAALRASETRLRLVVEQLPGVIWTVDRELRVTSVQGAGLKVMRRGVTELIGRTGPEILGEDDPLHDQVRRALAGESQVTEGRWFGRLYQVGLEPLRDEDGHIVGCLGVSWDVTELRESQAELLREREWAHVILESIADAVIGTDAEGRVVYLNPTAEDCTGWSAADALGRPAEEVFALVDELSGQALGERLRRALRDGRPFRLPQRSLLRRRDARLLPVEDAVSPIHDPATGFRGNALVFHDVSASRRLAAQLRHQATHDALTGLPNRELMLDRLEQSLRQAQRRERLLALLFLDLDRFKHINDTLGHDIGDQLLRQVAGRLRDAVRRTDTVCRLGGDEFVILAAEPARVEDVADLAEKIVGVMARPFLLNRHELHLTTSIGIALYPDDGVSRDVLLKHADIAMYHAKDGGRNTFRFFTAEMNRRAEERLFLEHGLRRALRQGELAVHYQPQVDLRSGRVVSVEALLRWRHPRLGSISPERFVPVAEDVGLIVEIGAWVLQRACEQGTAWLRAGLPVKVAVNVSAVQLHRADMVTAVSEALWGSGLPAGQLILELTETAVMHSPEHTAERLTRLKALGVHIAVDDFGTGYSSLSYLKQFPVDCLKIDRSFVLNLAEKSSDAAIATAIVRLAQSLRLDVTAEGVETEDALAFLVGQGCHLGQGHLFSAAGTPEEIEPLLRGGVRH